MMPAEYSARLCPATSLGEEETEYSWLQNKSSKKEDGAESPQRRFERASPEGFEHYSQAY